MAEEITLTVSGRDYAVSLYDSSQAAELRSRLPLTLTFENFGSSERIAYLPERLSISRYKERVNVKRGSLAYYVPWGNLCVFRVNYHSPNDLVLLGEMSEEAVRAVEQSGSSEAVLHLK